MERERERSFDQLEEELDAPLDDELRLVARVPSATDAQRLLGAVRDDLT